jgi:hypothetical protein
VRATVGDGESAAEVISLRRASAGDLGGAEFESQNGAARVGEGPISSFWTEDGA